MQVFNSIKSAAGKDMISVRAYKGDAMTLLCFDVDQSLSAGLAGFSIKYVNATQNKFIYNRMIFPDAFRTANPQIPKADRNSTLYSPIQRFSWIHVPNVQPDGGDPVFGDYRYEITPRYIMGGHLEDLDPAKTVAVEIDVSPYNVNKTQVGFARGFVSSEAYVGRFGLANHKVRPPAAQDTLLFDVNQKSGTAKRWSDAAHAYVDTDYTYLEQHKWLGWQARQRIIDFLDETIADPTLSLKMFAYDLDEPEIARRLLTLAAAGRLKTIVDDSGSTGTASDHGNPASFETSFVNDFKGVADPELIARGHFSALAHTKVMIRIKAGDAVKVLTGSTNFSTNGLYVNANHVLIFDSPVIAAKYDEVFEAAFGPAKMGAFKGGPLSAGDFAFAEPGLPAFTVTFAPHAKTDAQRIFDRISQRILHAGSDVFFAVMNDTSASSILDAIRDQVRSGTVFTYGITDTIGKTNTDYGVFVYKPNSKRGVRVAAKGVANVLPPPFGEVPGIDGYAIHHKFVVVDLKGDDPTVYCGSSNLAFGPEQKNGDNLLEIHDRDIATAFAIEASRLVDHFEWRNKDLTQNRMDLDDLSGPAADIWFQKYYAPDDLRCLERTKFIAPG